MINCGSGQKASKANRSANGHRAAQTVVHQDGMHKLLRPRNESHFCRDLCFDQKRHQLIALPIRHSAAQAVTAQKPRATCLSRSVFRSETRSANRLFHSPQHYISCHCPEVRVTSLSEFMFHPETSSADCPSGSPQHCTSCHRSRVTATGLWVCTG